MALWEVISCWVFPGWRWPPLIACWWFIKREQIVSVNTSCSKRWAFMTATGCYCSLETLILASRYNSYFLIFPFCFLLVQFVGKVENIHYFNDLLNKIHKVSGTVFINTPLHYLFIYWSTGHFSHFMFLDLNWLNELLKKTYAVMWGNTPLEGTTFMSHATHFHDGL